MKCIFVKSYICCYLKLMCGDFTFFADENFWGKSYHYLMLEEKK